jgi:hypothetical protein
MLVVTLDLWKAGYYSAESVELVQAHLEQATQALTQRFDQLRNARRFVPRAQAGWTLLDLDQAQRAAEPSA